MNFINRTLSVVAIAFVTSMFIGCGPGTIARTGFIPLTVPMTKSKIDDETSIYKLKGFSLAQYGSVKVELSNSDKLGDLKLKPEELEDLRTRFQASLTKALESTVGTGARVLMVRGEMTALKPNNPLLNVAPQSQILKRGYGYAACEIFATDGVDGQVVAAWMNTQDTQRFSAEKLSTLGTAQKACEKWGPEFRKFLTN